MGDSQERREGEVWVRIESKADAYPVSFAYNRFSVTQSGPILRVLMGFLDEETNILTDYRSFTTGVFDLARLYPSFDSYLSGMEDLRRLSGHSIANNRDCGELGFCNHLGACHVGGPHGQIGEMRVSRFSHGVATELRSHGSGKPREGKIEAHPVALAIAPLQIHISLLFRLFSYVAKHNEPEQ
jgi:hypothetical protein